MSKIINRKTKEIIENKNPKGSYFLYSSFLGRFILKIVNKRFLSVFVGFFLNRRISKLLIKKFIKSNNLNMDEYEDVKYKSFNQFFSRKIKNGSRNFPKNKKELCSPADSKLLIYKINKDLKFIIKNKEYNIERILKDNELAKEFNNGYLLVFRLEVDDYHRYSYIDDGSVILRKKIKGLYNTVAPIAFDRFKVFEENIREYEVQDTNKFGRVIQMEVGAMFVGKIKNYYLENFKRGDEKGYFLFGGSTIIMIFKDKSITIDKDILENSKNNLETKIVLGEKIGEVYE